MRTLSLSSLLALLLVLLAPGTSSAFLGIGGDNPDAEITKVKYEWLNLGIRFKSEDPMINFERRQLLWGSYKTADYYAKAGKYYTIFWRSKDRSPGLVVRFEYRQANTEDEVHVKDVAVDNVKRRNIARFEVIGDEFKENGNVLSWRVSLVRGEEVVATSESFLWD
ncbi:MAG: hypothetical protein ACI8UO_000182 [Verrucomicrobiales bacterium]|jgi:hypothetical protein